MYDTASLPEARYLHRRRALEMELLVSFSLCRLDKRICSALRAHLLLPLDLSCNRPSAFPPRGQWPLRGSRLHWWTWQSWWKVGWKIIVEWIGFLENMERGFSLSQAQLAPSQREPSLAEPTPTLCQSSTAEYISKATQPSSTNTSPSHRAYAFDIVVPYL